MRNTGLHCLVLAALLAPLSAQAAGGTAEISFVQPDRYTDAALYGGNGDRARAPVLDMLKAEFGTLAARYLAPGQTVKIGILDVDLAGRYEWWAQPNGIRVLNAVTWPSFKLSYELDENGAVLSKGEERVSDLDYLTRVETRSSDPLWREKAMLTDWFRHRFAPRQSARN